MGCGSSAKAAVDESNFNTQSTFTIPYLKERCIYAMMSNVQLQKEKLRTVVAIGERLGYDVDKVGVDYKTKVPDTLESEDFRMDIVEAIKEDTKGLVLKDKHRKVITISFEGTTSLQNVMTDFNAKCIAMNVAGFGMAENCVEVHGGFLEGTQALYDLLVKEKKLLVTKEEDKEYKIQLIGHSLGGALAVLFTPMLIQDGYNVIEIVTFGQPKVGTTPFNEGFRQLLKEYNIRYMRVRDKDDMVPFVPPTLINFKSTFVHNGECLVIDKDHPECFAYLSDDEIKMNKKIEGFLANLDVTDVLSHVLGNYYSTLKSMVKAEETHTLKEVHIDELNVDSDDPPMKNSEESKA